MDFHQMRFVPDKDAIIEYCSKNYISADNVPINNQVIKMLNGIWATLKEQVGEAYSKTPDRIQITVNVNYAPSYYITFVKILEASGFVVDYELLYKGLGHIVSC